MKYRILFLLAVFFISVVSVAHTASAQRQLTSYEKQRHERNRSAVSIIGGGISGTYIRYATDLANILDDLEGNSMRILPQIGRGGGQNVLDILFLRGIDMGLTQQDHLAFFKALNPNLYGDIDQRVRYITKLYNSEYHLVARSDIKSFEQLRGKKVNFWRPWSATDIGSKTIFRLLDIDVEPIYIDTQLALEKVKKGEIAATVLLAGAPVPKFSGLKPQDGLHIVPLGLNSLTKEQYAKLLEIYLPTRLTHKQYPAIIPEGQEVSSVASGVVLAVYNWDENSERYKKVARFVDAFFSNFDKLLKPPRHPKWKEVNLAANIPGWTRFKAAEQWLAQASAKPNAKTRQAFNSFLQSTGANGRKLSKQDTDQLFKEFMKWSRTNRQ